MPTNQVSVLSESEGTMLSEEEIAEIEARADAADEGPWRWRRDYEMPDGDKHWELSNPEGDRNSKTIDASLVLLLDRDEWLHRPAETQANWEFIARARTDIPALCATVKALRERLAQADADNERLSLVLQGIEEREAAVCPEDVGFDEHIRYLQSQDVALREQLAQETERADDNFTSYERVKASYSETVNRLSQVEQERDMLRSTADNSERYQAALLSSDFISRSRAVELCKQKAADYEGDLTTAHVLRALAGALEKL